MRTITLTPAYGRDYSSKANVLADWDANKDFIIQDIRLSGYVNKAQVPAAVATRFARLFRDREAEVRHPGVVSAQHAVHVHRF